MRRPAELEGAMRFCSAVSGLLLLLSGSAPTGSGPLICSQSRVCAVTGSAVTISCRISPPIRGRDAVLETLWFLNGRPVGQRSEPDSAGRVRTLCRPTACTLRLTDLRESDSGRYQLWVRTNRGSYRGSPGASLTVTALQVAVLKAELRGSFSRADLKCVSSCQADHQSYIWTRNGREVLNQTSGSVSVSVHPADSYSCSLEGNQDFPSPSVYPPLPPSVSVSPSAQVEQGGSVTLTCSSDANPAASYSWYKDSITNSPSQDSQLVFSSIQSSDSGWFICKAGNQLGWKWSGYKLIDVQYPPLPPSVSVSPSAQVEQGGSVTLTCSSDANPAASYSWYKDDEESPRASGQNFIITDVRPEHSGNYSCRAENTRGRQSATVHLEVKDVFLSSVEMMDAVRLILVVLVPVLLLVLGLRTRVKKTGADEAAEMMQIDPDYQNISTLKASADPRGATGKQNDLQSGFYSSGRKE